jgi:hypothetical protein
MLGFPDADTDGLSITLFVDNSANVVNGVVMNELNYYVRAEWWSRKSVEVITEAGCGRRNGDVEMRM